MNVAKLALDLSVEYNGRDLTFNDGLLKRFSHDQLFYVGYARQHCSRSLNSNQKLINLLTSPSVPSEYKIQGTLQNTPSFASAFNCPAEADYRLDNHCDVFNGAGGKNIFIIANLSQNISAKSEQQINSINVRPKKEIQPGPKYGAYQDVVKFLNYSMDFNADPCNDFYKYACGNYQKPVSFRVFREENYKKQATAIKKINVDTEVRTSTFALLFII